MFVLFGVCSNLQDFVNRFPQTQKRKKEILSYSNEICPSKGKNIQLPVTVFDYYSSFYNSSVNLNIEFYYCSPIEQLN